MIINFCLSADPISCRKNRRGKKQVAEHAIQLERQRENTGALNHLGNAVDCWFTDEFHQANPDIIEWRRRKSLQNDPESYTAAYQMLAYSDLADELHQITTPTLAITGECDIGSTPRICQLIASRVQNGRSVILPGLKHPLLLEAPEQIATALESFIIESCDEQV